LITIILIEAASGLHARKWPRVVTALLFDPV
jgi:hypothetical protein